MKTNLLAKKALEMEAQRIHELGIEFGARSAGSVYSDYTDFAAGGFQLSLGFGLHNKAAGIAICNAYRAILWYYYCGAPLHPEEAL